uniref:C1q domain-containing protein n=1 Tax=Astatotilapia calliptera TaxID=8154 RepID=A0A3P8N611_ASTCA
SCFGIDVSVNFCMSAITCPKLKRLEMLPKMAPHHVRSGGLGSMVGLKGLSAGIGGGSPLGPFNTDQTIIYERVFVNTGNAYNELTGIFTAPVSGVYFFTYFCHSGGVRKTSLHLYKNNEVILHIHDHQSADTADNGGNAVFLQLQQGDRVYVRLKANTHVYRSSTLTNFSGFLVKKKKTIKNRCT